MNCEKCGVEIDGTFQSGRFCSARCRALFCSSFVNQNVRLQKSSQNHFRVHLNINDQDLREAHKDSKSVAEIVRKLNVRLTTHSSKVVVEKLQELGLERPKIRYHNFRDQNKNLILENVFKKHDRETNSPRREALLQAGVKLKCSLCDLGPQWMEKELCLQVDHINGDPSDDRFENLRFLCPNCHSQTDTFCAKNRSRSLTVKRTNSNSF